MCRLPLNACTQPDSRLILMRQVLQGLLYLCWLPMNAYTQVDLQNKCNASPYETGSTKSDVCLLAASECKVSSACRTKGWWAWGKSSQPHTIIWWRCHSQIIIRSRSWWEVEWHNSHRASFLPWGDQSNNWKVWAGTFHMEPCQTTMTPSLNLHKNLMLPLLMHAAHFCSFSHSCAEGLI